MAKAHAATSTARDCADDQERLCAADDRFGQGCVRGLVREVLLAGEEPQEWSALLRLVVANGAAQDGILLFERIENRTLRDGAVDGERHLAVDLGVHAKMGGQHNADHIGKSFQRLGFDR